MSNLNIGGSGKFFHSTCSLARLTEPCNLVSHDPLTRDLKPNLIISLKGIFAHFTLEHAWTTQTFIDSIVN